MAVDDRELEVAVRRLLSRRRPTSVPSANLRQRVHSVAAQGAPFEPARRFLLSTASAVLLAAVAVVGYVALYGLDVANHGPSSSAPPLPFDMNATDIGIVHWIGDTLHFVPWVIGGGVALALGAMVLGSQDWRRRLAGAVLTALTVAGAGLITSQPGVAFSDTSGLLPGVTEFDQPAAIQDQRYVYVSSEPGQPFGIIFNVQNDGLLPVRVLGVVDYSGDGYVNFEWTGVWMYQHHRGGVPEPTAARPFQQLDLQPGERVLLYIVGRAGQCAFGPTFDPTATDLNFASTDTISIAYSVLGLTAVSEVQSPITVMEPIRPNCVGPEG